MSIKTTITSALKKQGAAFANITERHLETVQEHSYHLHTTPPYFIKWISNDDRLGQNEIWVNQTILSGANIHTPDLFFIIRLANAAVACWEWLDGVDLRRQHRDRLAEAFAQLGHFHAQNRHDQPVYSLITLQSHPTITALLEAELEFLGGDFGPQLFQKTREAFSILELGYPTYAHGDMHPGNIYLTKNRLGFVDWGYARSSLSLFDLGYIETVNFESTKEDEWWRITPAEAKQVLPAYYDACGLHGCNIQQIHRSIMLWAKLWAYHNAARNKNNAAGLICKRQITHLMDLP